MSRKEVMELGISMTCRKLEELGWKCKAYKNDQKDVSRVISKGEKEHIVIIRSLSGDSPAMLVPSDIEPPYEYIILCVNPKEDPKFYVLTREEATKHVYRTGDTLWLEDYEPHRDRWDKLES